MTDGPRPSSGFEGSPANSLEFLGLPGAGKTTIYKLILRELASQRVPWRSIERDAAKILAPKHRGLLTKLFRGLAARELKRPPDSTSAAKYKAFAAFVRDYPDFVRFVFESPGTRIAPSSGSELLLLGWAMEQSWSYQAVRHDNRASNALLVRDHGFCQLAISILPYRELGEDELESQTSGYFSGVPAPKYLVVLRPSRQKVEERLAARGFPDRMKRLTPEGRAAVLDRASRCVDMGVALLRKRSVEILEIDNDGTRADLEESARSIVGKIAMGQRGSAA
jgi:adenylate kinase